LGGGLCGAHVLECSNRVIRASCRSPDLHRQQSSGGPTLRL
jgi:hypothetical protein